MSNVTIKDNGSAYIIMVDGLIVSAHNSLGNAWRHIAWMYRVATQQFTVTPKKIPVKEWLNRMIERGYLEERAGFDYV